MSLYFPPATTAVLDSQGVPVPSAADPLDDEDADADISAYVGTGMEPGDDIAAFADDDFAAFADDLTGLRGHEDGPVFDDDPLVASLEESSDAFGGGSDPVGGGTDVDSQVAKRRRVDSEADPGV